MLLSRIEPLQTRHSADSCGLRGNVHEHVCHMPNGSISALTDNLLGQWDRR